MKEIDQELIDILDSYGSKTGETATRKKVHEEGLWHKACHVWVISPKFGILVQKRSENKKSNPGKWDLSVGGHIESRSESLETSVRELEEELGLVVNSEDLIYMFTHKSETSRDDILYINREFRDVYFINVNKNLEDFIIQESELSEIAWISFDDFEKEIKERNPRWANRWKEFEESIEFFKINNYERS